MRSRSGVPILTIEDWEHHASTEGNGEPYFSAMALARLWLDEARAGSQAVIDALAPALPDLVLGEGIAEAQVAFDAYPGGVRNHDMLACGHVDGGGVVVGVEGKVNESLDATITRKHKEAARPRAPRKRSNLAKLVGALLLATAGRSLQNDPALGKPRYQLFSAVAGTLAAAREDTVAVVVHAIRTPLAKEADLSKVGPGREEIVDPIEHGDEAAAELAIRRHIVGGVDDVIRRLGGDPDQLLHPIADGQGRSG